MKVVETVKTNYGDSDSSTKKKAIGRDAEASAALFRFGRTYSTGPTAPRRLPGYRQEGDSAAKRSSYEITHPSSILFPLSLSSSTTTTRNRFIVPRAQVNR